MKARTQVTGDTPSPFEVARELLSRGWSLIPADPLRKRHDAELLPNGWKSFQQRQATAEELSHWQGARAFALVCGSLSGVVVLDVDPGGDRALHGKHLPLTPTARTPRGGRHYYFRHPGQRVRTTTHILGRGSRVDIRGDGGIVLLPGSVGREWIISPDQHELADMPDWLFPLAVMPPAMGSNRGSKHSNVYVTAFSLPTVARFDGGRLTGDELREYANRLDVGLDVATFLRLPTDGLTERGSTATFCCILPGHQERNPSASLYMHPQSGAVLYRDWHGKSGHQDYALTDVFAALCHRHTRRLRPSELATWQLRLLVEIGCIAPYPIEMKPLPPHVDEATRKVYDGFKLLLGCKWRHTPNEPTPFTRGFAAAWCGVSEPAAKEAIHQLHTELHIIRIVGQHGYLRLWLPWYDTPGAQGSVQSVTDEGIRGPDKRGR
jgi:hypothetical protein